MNFQQTNSNDEPSRSGWAGNKVIQVCIMILKVITALPDNKQTQRIEWIMLNKEKVLIAGVGVPTLLTYYHIVAFYSIICLIFCSVT